MLAAESGDGSGLAILLVILYVVPSIVAVKRNVPSIGSVIVINLLLGWTFIGWVIALAMAMRDPAPRFVRPPRRH